jgi:hypothetical protein
MRPWLRGRHVTGITVQPVNNQIALDGAGRHRHRRVGERHVEPPRGALGLQRRRGARSDAQINRIFLLAVSAMTAVALAFPELQGTLGILLAYLAFLYVYLHL